MDTPKPQHNDQGDDLKDAKGGIPLGAGVDIMREEEDADDIEIESYNDDVLAPDEVTLEERLKRLKEKLRECNKERLEFLDGWQRVKADFINLKKREAEEKAEFLKFAREGLITDLLPVLESFHMAFANKEAWEKGDPSWRKGVEHIHAQLAQTLASYGLTEVDPLGEMFNPSEHTAIGTVGTADKKEHHKIAEVVQLGYRLNGKLIKTPAVKIYAEATSDVSSEGNSQYPISNNQ